MAKTKREKYGIPYCSEHATWYGMWLRCVDPTNNAYGRYGKKGIKVCERWRDFFAFAEDMGRKPSPTHSLDRIDPKGNYEPDNCRWATPRVQQLNRADKRYSFYQWKGERRTPTEIARIEGVDRRGFAERLKAGRSVEQALIETKAAATRHHGLQVTIDNETRYLREWAKHFGTDPKLAWERVAKHGWNWKDALTRPLTKGEDKTYQSRLKITINGETKGLNQWMRHFGLSKGLVWKRVAAGMTYKEALTTPRGLKRGDLNKFRKRSKHNDHRNG